MTPAQARAFQAVALEGSFTAAARSLRVSQPTVTNQVKQLETHYEVELFHRSGRGVRLTRTGEELLSIVRRMFGSYQEATEFLQATQGMRRGHLRVGSYGPYDVIKMVARFKQRHPAIEVSLAFANSRFLGKKLLDYDLDVAVFSRIEYHPEFHVLPFNRPPLVVIAPRNGAWESETSIAIAELKGHRLVCREHGSAAREAFDRLFVKSGISPDDVVEVGSREGTVSAVAEGMGVSIIFDEGVVPEDRVVKLRIRDCDIRTNVDVVCLTERKDSPTVRSFLSIAESLVDKTRLGAAVRRNRA
ncbi:MAG: LysR family transcriptional regulator [Alphaproteobacteria bacterium]|nr:LysR family transcriptional regulator [Alphaproteobacteria bacterium]